MQVLKTYTLPLLLFALLSFVLTLPVGLRPNQLILGNENGDMFPNIWAYHWFKSEFLEEHQFPWHTDQLRYPPGGTFFFLDTMNALLSIPLQSIFPLVSVFNLLNLLQLTLIPFGTWLLLRYLIKDQVAAYIGAIIFGYSPYVLTILSNGVTETLNLGFFPLYCLLLWQLPGRRNFRWALLCGLVLFLNGLACWNYAIFCLLFTACFFSYDFLSHIKKYKKKLFEYKKIYPYLIIGGVFALGYAPIAFGLSTSLKAQDSLITPHSGVDLPQKVEHWQERSDSLDLANLLRTGKPEKKQQNYSHTTVYHVIYLGYIPLFLAFLGLFPLKKRKIFLLALTLIFLMLACGAGLYIKGERIDLGGSPLPMPAYFLNFIFPFLVKMELPYRYAGGAMLFIAILASYGVSRLGSKLSSPLKWGFALGVIGLILLETLLLSPTPFPIRHASAKVPKYTMALAKQQDIDAILDLPLLNLNSLKERFIYLSAFHGKKIPYNMENLGAKEVIYNPFVYSLGSLCANGNFPAEMTENHLKKGFQQLAELGYDRIVIHTWLFPERCHTTAQKKINQILVSLAGAPIFHDDEVIVFQISPEASRSSPQ